jgi:hypothetical protein
MEQVQSGTLSILNIVSKHKFYKAIIFYLFFQYIRINSN